MFRIGHLGDFNDLMLAGTLAGVQMGLQLAGHDVGDGVGAALERLKRVSALDGAAGGRALPGDGGAVLRPGARRTWAPT